MPNRTQILVINNFINGKRVETESYLEGHDPSTGEVFLSIADSDYRHAELAIQAAEQAFQSWSQTCAQDRSKILLKIADILESRLEEFARAESRDQGKPLWLARTVDIPRAVHNFRTFATAILHSPDRSTYIEHQMALNYTIKEPAGIAVLISPWNLPLYLLTFKLAPAIACGNTVVCKPSEFTSLTASMLCNVLVEAGVPHGVVNMVFGVGSKIGEALVRDSRCRLISFTGSTVTANKIRAACADTNKKISLELGGKNAAIVFDDCNLEKCIKTTLRSSFINQGEVCLCTSRIFVQRGIYDKFLEKFVAETKKLRVGDPLDDTHFLGALVSKQHWEKVNSYIELAKHTKDVEILFGQEPLHLGTKFEKGYFMLPHIFVGATDDSRLMQEEIFGPVVCITPFTDKHEVIKRVNNSSFGLCGVIWSENVNTIHSVARHLKVGTVWANCWMVRDLNLPFGGTKNSGIGREGVFESIEFYTEPKTVCVHLSD